MKKPCYSMQTLTNTAGRLDSVGSIGGLMDNASPLVQRSGPGMDGDSSPDVAPGGPLSGGECSALVQVMLHEATRELLMKQCFFRQF